ncbi:hypothetical protein L210DRAFT_3578829 [Boletus edulis BED1]|uniref:DNA 3'-5' helicase n=1 Tax=Boletus edulis BED1 TaxID=1328754 RepID=A0AAD4BCV2_BOLED|nr:hypothetical protein L210DRAFT_3578829 [Boletus edulis BED1]
MRRLCQVAGCLFPTIGSPKEAAKEHQANYHSLARTVQYQGTPVLVTRDGQSGTLPCPCGNPHHARYSFRKMYSLCRKNPHPQEDHVFPDDPIEASQSTSLPTRQAQYQTITDSESCEIPLDWALSPVTLDAPFEDPCPTEDVAALFKPDTPAVAPPNASTPDVSPQHPPVITLPAVDMDVDSEGEETSQDFDIDLTTLPSFTATPPVAEPSVTQELFSLGLRVDDRFQLTICLECCLPINFAFAHAHLVKNHKSPRFVYPPKQTLEDMLLALHADKVKSVFPGPISPIPGLAVVDAIKCTLQSCPAVVVFPNRKRFYEHCQRDHPSVPKKQLSWSGTKGHQLAKYRANRQMVEVCDSLSSPSSLCIADILQHSDAVQLYGLPETFKLPANARIKGTIFAQVGWEDIFDGVNVRDLRLTVNTPDHTEPLYQRLVESVEGYYAHVSPRIKSLPILTSRCIASASELGSQPFKALQERDTLKKYSRLTGLFLVFLMRHLKSPTPSFDVPFHPHHAESLSLLGQELSSGTTGAIEECIHSTLSSLLTYTSLEARKSDHRDLLTLFLAAYHLRDDAGNTTRISAVPPNLSALQWCFRATAVREVLDKASQYDGDTYTSYEKHAKGWVTDGLPSLFTSLRQKHALFSTLAYAELPGLPRFNWDSSLKILAVDGFPLSVDALSKSVSAVQMEMEGLINKLCLGIDFGSVFSYIDSRTDPTNAKMWFVDRPREDLQGTSVVSQDASGLASFSTRLLEAVARDGRFFSKVGGILAAQKLAIWGWITDLDELVSAMYYAITLTWGGGARGTECDHLKHTVHGVGDRHVFVLNGLLGIATTYVKTQQIQGHGRLIVRTPCPSISRLVLFALSVLYPVAAKLSAFVMRVEDAQTYLSYLFVHHGTVLDSKRLSLILQHYTEKYLGTALGLRDYRQVMCSMLCCIAGTDYGAPDDDDHELAAIHAQFGHSVSVADAHYGIQGSNALATVSHTAVRSMQRVSIRWHVCLGHGHPSFSDDSGQQEGADATVRILEALKAPLSHAVQETVRAYMQDFYNSTVPHWTSILQGFGSDLTSHISNAAGEAPPLSPSQLSPLIVHPSLADRLQPLYPGQAFSFTCSQQAELVQSCFTNDHVLAVLPTGSGKSLAFFGAALLNPEDLFIVVTPFVALMEDMVRRLAASPITGGRWCGSISPTRDQVVIVPAHEAGSDYFFKWSEASTTRLRRVFIDEAHHVFTSDSYRPCFRLFHRLTQLKKPITFLSATLSARSIPALCSSMMIQPALLRIIRAPTSRPNIKYRVTKVPSDDIIRETVNTFRSISLSPSERGIIYTTSIAFTLDIAKILGIPAYTSRILEDDQENKAEKTRIFQQWRSGEVQWVAATICFAEGVDFQSVRYAVIVEPRDMLSFLQESGRLGRDGLPSTAITLWSWVRKISSTGDPDHSGKSAMVRFLESNTCRRLAFVDFDPDVHSCASSANNQLCDSCEKLSRSDKLHAPQALRFDLPVVCKVVAPSNPLPVSVSVQSNGQAIQDLYQVGHGKLQRLRKVIAHVTAIRCADCWVLGEAQVGQHTHARHYRFASLLSSLRAKQRKDNTFWPACYLCWIPFHAPCSHPQLRRGDRITSGDCPNPHSPYLIPTLITLIYLHDDKLNALSQVTGVLGLNPPMSTKDPLERFIEWISEPPHSPDAIPNYALFLITFAECFNKL